MNLSDALLQDRPGYQGGLVIRVVFVKAIFSELLPHIGEE